MSGGAARTVGVVGLGRMGGPMAGRLVTAGFRVTGHDPAAAPPPGVRAAGELAELAGCDVVLVTVPGCAVPGVLTDAAGLRPCWRAATLLICSTLDPERARELHGLAAAGGARMLDAPLCRGDAAARDGTLLALVGGSAAVLAEVRDVLDAFCADVEHVGPAGAGQAAKLVNNLLLWTEISATVEGLRLAESLGVARGPLVAALRRSSAASWVLDTWDRPRAVPWAEEDMRMVRAAASRTGVDVPVAEAVAAAIGDIAATGLLAGGGFARPGWSRPA